MQMVWHYDKVAEPEFPGRYVGAKHVDHQTWHSVPTAAGRGLGWSWWWRRTYALNSGCCPEEHGEQVLPLPGAKAPVPLRCASACFLWGRRFRLPTDCFTTSARSAVVFDYGTSEVCRRSVSRNPNRLVSRCLRTSTGHARRFASHASASRLPKSGRPVDHPRNPGWDACGSRARPPAIWSSRSERFRVGWPAKNETSAWLKTLANE